MYNNGQINVTEKVAVEEKRNNIKNNLDRILNYEKYLNKAETSETATYAAEREATVADLNEKYTETEEKIYESEDITPSKTTMQFVNIQEEDFYEEINAKREVKEEKSYKLSTKSKVLIAVYALVIITIISLIILNSRMLKSLDASINDYTLRIDRLQEEYETVSRELEYVSSDEIISMKAEEMGMIRG